MTDWTQQGNKNENDMTGSLAQAGMLNNNNNINSISLRSIQSTFGTLPEMWTTIQRSFGSGSGQILKDQWLNQVNAINNANAQLNINSIGSILPHVFNTLSINKSNAGYNALPAEWFAQAQSPKPVPQQQLNQQQLNQQQLNQQQLNQQQLSQQQLNQQQLNQQQLNQQQLNQQQLHQQQLNQQQLHQQQQQQQSHHQASTNQNSPQLLVHKRSNEASTFVGVEDNPSSLMDHFTPNKVQRQDSPNPRTQFQKVQADVSPPAVKQESVSTASTPTSNARWNSWSHEEEVFLVVSVLDRFFRRGSLASSGKAKQSADCWAEIKITYDKICAAWHGLSENRVKPALIARSTSALCRHFKIMKVRASDGDSTGTNDGNFRKYLREWDTVYNVNGKLLPEEY